MSKHKCPKCGQPLQRVGMYYCTSCDFWFEEIDFLPQDVEYDEDCKKCSYLAETPFKKNNKTVYVCNKLGAPRIMEKMRDFRGCELIDRIQD